MLLIATAQRGTLLGLHKASFVVWVSACAIHVLAYARRMTRHLFDGRMGGGSLRIALVLIVLAAGLAVAVETYPLAAPWLHGLVRDG